MKYLQSKANKIVKLIIEWELSRSILKCISFNTLLPFVVRQYAILSLASLPIQSSAIYHKFRCPLSGQSRSIISFVKLNRMRFKILASFGYLNGIQKNSK